MQSVEPKAFRELVALMRSEGVSHFANGDITVTLGPAPLEDAPVVAESSDDTDEVAAAEQREKDAREAWDTYWSRLNASSGSPTPIFPGVERSELFLERAS